MKKTKEEFLKEGIEIFKTYLLQNKLNVIYKYGYGSDNQYEINKTENIEKISDYNLERYLESHDVNFTDFLNFINYLQNNSYHDLAIKQSILKTSNKNSYGYNENISKILKELSFNTNNLFKFVCRQKFIDYNLHKLETVFPLFDQQKKEKIIDLLFGLKSCKTIDNEVFIFNLIKNNLKNSKKFNDRFTLLNISLNDNKLNNSELDICIEECVLLKFKFLKTDIIEKWIKNGKLLKSENINQFINQITNAFNEIHDQNNKLKNLTGINFLSFFSNEKKESILKIECDKNKVELIKLGMTNLINALNHENIKFKGYAINDVNENQINITSLIEEKFLLANYQLLNKNLEQKEYTQRKIKI